MSTDHSLLLAGDIGGTKTALALYRPDQDPHQPLRQQAYPSQRYGSLSEIVGTFLDGEDQSVGRVVVGVAGPVQEGRAEITNLPWVIEQKELQATVGGAPTHILNDLEAIAHSIDALVDDDFHTLSTGDPEPEANLAVVAPGTGLGEAFLTYDGDRYWPQASEGGHVDFAPTTALQRALLEYLAGRFDRVSYERVCSGIGIPNIYDFLYDTQRADVPPTLAVEMAGATDRTPLIISNAMGDDPCDICRITLEIFVSILGSEAGNLTLKVMALAGVYLGGGIPPRILPALRQERFMRAFRHKGRLSDLLDDVPVYVITNPAAPLIGAASYGLTQMASS
jgi:glucokinase